MQTKLENLIKIKLTDEQLEQVQPLIERLLLNVLDQYGMTIGQLRYDPINGWFIGIGWITQDIAIKVAEIIYPDSEYNRKFIERDR